MMTQPIGVTIKNGNSSKDCLDILVLRSTIAERKNLHRLNGKFDMAEARTGEPTDRRVEIIQNENQRGKGQKKNEQKIRDL